MTEIGPETMRLLLEFQRNEITEHNIYLSLAGRAGKNREVLERIAMDELRHYSILKGYGSSQDCWTRQEEYPLLLHDCEDLRCYIRH